MKTTRKWHLADCNVKVALEAVFRDLMLGEFGRKHGIDHTMNVAGKRQAVDFC